jgi:hypothetical protein
VEWGARERKRALAASIAVTAVAALAVGMGGTARSASAMWPDGRVAALWPTFSEIQRVQRGEDGPRAWDGAFRRCVQSVRMELDYRCEYIDAAGNVGYACIAAGDSSFDLSKSSVNAVVAPRDPTYGAASPAQVCFASLAYAMSLG